MNIDKVLAWVTKIAGAVITAPATVIVAGQLFSDLPLVWRLLVQGAAVLLVEGVFLSNWLLLERDRRTDTAYKVRYSLTAFGLYIGLWVLAWSHGEGVAGIVFRLALGAALFGSIYDAGVYDLLRAQGQADRDISKAPRVRRKARQLERKLQIATLEANHDLELQRLRLQAGIEGDRLQKEAERNSKKVQREHRQELRKVEAESDDSTLLRGNPRYPVEQLNSEKRLNREQRLELMSEYANSNPELQPSEVVEWAQSTLGVAESTAWSYWSEVKSEPAPNGNGHRA